MNKKILEFRKLVDVLRSRLFIAYLFGLIWMLILQINHIIAFKFIHYFFVAIFNFIIMSIIKIYEWVIIRELKD